MCKTGCQQFGKKFFLCYYSNDVTQLNNMQLSAPTVKRQVSVNTAARVQLTATIMLLLAETHLPKDFPTDELLDSLVVRYQPSATATGNYAFECSTFHVDKPNLVKPTWFSESEVVGKFLATTHNVQPGFNWYIISLERLWNLYQTDSSMFELKRLKRSTLKTQNIDAHLLLCPCENVLASGFPLETWVSMAVVHWTLHGKLPTN